MALLAGHHDYTDPLIHRLQHSDFDSQQHTVFASWPWWIAHISLDAIHHDQTSSSQLIYLVDLGDKRLYKAKNSG